MWLGWVWRRASGRRIGPHRAEPFPPDFATEAQLVEHRRVVALDPGWQHVPFPGRRRKLEPVELRNRDPEAFDSHQPVDGRHVLPGEQESHELGGRDRLDVGTQARQRLPVDACEQPPVAPLLARPGRVKHSSQDDSFGFQRDQRGKRRRFGQADWPPPGRSRRGASPCALSADRSAPAPVSTEPRRVQRVPRSARQAQPKGKPLVVREVVRRRPQNRIRSHALADACTARPHVHPLG